MKIPIKHSTYNNTFLIELFWTVLGLLAEELAQADGAVGVDAPVRIVRDLPDHAVRVLDAERPVAPGMVGDRHDRFDAAGQNAGAFHIHIFDMQVVGQPGRCAQGLAMLRFHELQAGAALAEFEVDVPAAIEGHPGTEVLDIERAGFFQPIGGNAGRYIADLHDRLLVQRHTEKAHAPVLTLGFCRTGVYPHAHQT